MNRKPLLPPYLETEPVWTDLIDALDTTFLPTVDNPTKFLSRLRDTWIVPESTEEKIQQGKMLSSTDFDTYEKEILVRQANMLGFDFRDSNVLSSEDYERITRHLGFYWYGKGTPSFINFLGFVLNTVITVKNLWSDQGASPRRYGTFLPEGNPGIGTPVWQGGAGHVGNSRNLPCGGCGID